MPVPAATRSAEIPRSQRGFQDGVLKSISPATDLNMTVQGISTPTPFGLADGCFYKDKPMATMMMGDLVLLQMR